MEELVATVKKETLRTVIWCVIAVAAAIGIGFLVLF